MSSSTSKPVKFDVEGPYGSVTEHTVTCTHSRTSDTTSFDFSDGEHLVFMDDRWIAMLKANASLHKTVMPDDLPALVDDPTGI